MNNKIIALALCLGALQFSSHSFAQGWPLQPGTKVCLQNSQNLPSGIAMGGEYKVIHGPYHSTCTTVLHSFQLRMTSGGRLPVTVEKLVDGAWQKVIDRELDPARELGSGTFRVMIDNAENTSPVAYKGKYTIPL